MQKSSEIVYGVPPKASVTQEICAVPTLIQKRHQEKEIDLLHHLALREKTRKVKEKEKARHLLQTQVLQEYNTSQHAIYQERKLPERSQV